MYKNNIIGSDEMERHKLLIKKKEKQSIEI